MSHIIFEKMRKFEPSIQYENEAFRQPNDICTNCGSNILKNPEMIIPYII